MAFSHWERFYGRIRTYLVHEAQVGKFDMKNNTSQVQLSPLYTNEFCFESAFVSPVCS